MYTCNKYAYNKHHLALTMLTISFQIIVSDLFSVPPHNLPPIPIHI